MTDAPSLRAFLQRWRFRQIRGKLIFGFSLQLALVGAVAAIALIGLRDVQRSFQSAIQEGLEMERLADQIQNALLRARRSEADFLLRWPTEGFEKARGEYAVAEEQNVAQIRELADHLEKAQRAAGPVDPDNRTMDDLVELRPYVDVYSEDFESIVRLIASWSKEKPAADARGRRPPQEDGVRRRVDRGVDDLRAAAAVVEPLVGDIAQNGQRDARAKIASAQAATARTIVGVGLCFLAAMLIGIGIAYKVARQIRSPLLRLTRAAEGIGAGHLTARADITSQDEFGRLATTFNAMTSQVQGLVEALRNSRELLQSIIDTSSTVIYVKDLEGKYLLVNRRFQELFDGGDGSMVGKTDYDIFPRDAAEAFRAVDRRVVSTGKAIEAEETAPHADGVHTYISIKCPLRDRDGRTYAMCGISTDITEHKRVEEQLRQSQKLEAIGRLAGGVAHDFNNLLTVINGFSSIALQRIEPEHPLRRLLSEILAAGERAAGLTGQLLAYSRKQTVEPKVWDLNAIVSEIEPMMKRLIGEDIDLVTILGANVGAIRADRGQLQQVLMNLVINAREAMPSGGKLTIETSNTVLHDGERGTHLGAGAGPHTVLSVSDSGVGMTPDVKAKIFEPFFTTKGVGQGTGLGLSVVYGIVQQSRGGIGVYSEPGHGTTIRVYWPHVQNLEQVPSPIMIEDAPGRGNGETVLLVEDETAVRNLGRYVLEEEGYILLEAANGAEACRLMESYDRPIALVITDVVMPTMGGVAFANWMRDHHPSVPILFISGYTQEAAARGGAAEIGENFLQKPFSPMELRMKVWQVLDGARMRQPPSVH
jgi:PAS domain S-box-containing protein